MIAIGGDVNLREKYFPSPDLPEVFKQSIVGQNVLFDFGNKLSLVKFKSFEFEVLDPNIMYAGGVRILNGISLLKAFRPEEDWSNCRDDLADGIKAKLSANVYATHRLDFTLDKEFQVYFPNTSMGTDLMFEIRHAFSGGKITDVSGSPKITNDPFLINERLRQIVRPQYFEQVVVPFLESRPTSIRIPGTKSWKEWFAAKKKQAVRSWDELLKPVKNIQQGDFLYVGSSDQVYLLGAVYSRDGLSRYYSTKPSLYFARNYLGFTSQHQGTLKPPPPGVEYYDSGKYLDWDIPGFQGKRFVFLQIGRGQDCKNSCDMWNATIITSSLEEAVEHFKMTDFAEYGDLVVEYAKRINEPHPTEKPNGRWFN